MMFKKFSIIALTFILAACAGTVKRDTTSNASSFSAASFSSVKMSLTPEARILQADNSQFNSAELKAYIERKLDANSLLDPRSPYQIDVAIESFRVRSAVTAVLFGIMAGTDSITGRVNVIQNGRSVHGFVVDASYGLGGIMGADSTRMNWLYDKFAELTVKELIGNTDPSSVVRQKTSLAPVSVPQNMRSLPSPSGYADTYDLTKVPGTEGCKKAYTEWLEKPSPKAFAISGTARCFYSWGNNPADKTLPKDPTERTLFNCNLTTNNLNNCKLYAVDGVVVWKP